MIVVMMALQDRVLFPRLSVVEGRMCQEAMRNGVDPAKAKSSREWSGCKRGSTKTLTHD